MTPHVSVQALFSIHCNGTMVYAGGIVEWNSEY